MEGKKHGKSTRRTWRKIHLATCPNSHEIIVSYLGENNEADCEAVPKMTPSLPRSVKRAYGDGAYDTRGVRKDWFERGIDSIVPSKRGAVLHDSEEEPCMRGRNDAIRAFFRS